MRKVLRGYAKDKDGNLIVIGTIAVLIAKTNALQKNVKRNGIWSDEAQPPLRKKSFVSNNPTRHATIVAIGDSMKKAPA